MRRWSRSRSRIATGLLLAACAGVAGVLPALVSPLIGVALSICGLLVFGLLALRRAVPPARSGVSTRASQLHRRIGSPAPADPDSPAASADDEGAAIRLARILFYLGCLLVGQLAFRYAAGVTIGEMMFIASFGLCVLAVLGGRVTVAVPTPLLAPMAVFVLGGAISSLDAQSAPNSAFQLLHAVYVLLLWPTVGAMVLRRRQHVITGLTLWSISAAINGLGAIAQMLGAHLPNVPQSGSRMTGFTEYPNDLGGACAVALVPALMLATRPPIGQAVLGRVLRWLPVALIAVGLAVSGSVSAMAAAAVAVLVWLSSPLVRGTSRIAVAAAIVCALAIVVVAGGRVASPVQRLAQVANPTAQGGGSVQDRFAIAERAWPRIVADPFVGTGLDTADSGVTIISHDYTTPYQIHGLPLAAWYQSGLFGLIGIMALLIVLAAVGWRGLAAGATEEEMLVGLSLLAAFAAFVVFAMTQPMVFQEYGWISAVFLVAWRLRSDVSRSRVAVGYQPDLTGARGEPAHALATRV